MNTDTDFNEITIASGLRQELIDFCRNETVAMNPLVSTEEVSSRLEKANITELIDLTILFMGGELKKLEINKEDLKK